MQTSRSGGVALYNVWNKSSHRGPGKVLTSNSFLPKVEGCVITMQLLSTEGSRMTGQLNLSVGSDFALTKTDKQLPHVHKITVFDQNKVSNLDSLNCFHVFN